MQAVEMLDKTKRKFVTIESKDIKAGDIVKVNEGDIFACDICLLSSSSPEGEAFIKTSSLDGEKNLKKRIVPKDLDKLVPSGDQERAIKNLLKMSGELFVQLPEKKLDKFDGFIMENGI